MLSKVIGIFAVLCLIGTLSASCVEGISHSQDAKDGSMGTPAAAPQIVGGGVVPVLGVGATVPLANGSATGGGPGLVNLTYTGTGFVVPVVTAGNGAQQFSLCTVTNPHLATNAWTVNTARSDTQALTSLPLVVLFVQMPVQL